MPLKKQRERERDEFVRFRTEIKKRVMVVFKLGLV